MDDVVRDALLDPCPMHDTEIPDLRRARFGAPPRPYLWVPHRARWRWAACPPDEEERYRDGKNDEP